MDKIRKEMTHSPEWAKDKINQWLRLVLTSYRRHWETEGKEKPKAAEIAATGELFDATVKEISSILLSAHAEGRKEERERCAKIADDMVRGKCCDDISEAIRSATKREVGDNGE